MQCVSRRSPARPYTHVLNTVLAFHHPRYHGANSPTSHFSGTQYGRFRTNGEVQDHLVTWRVFDPHDGKRSVRHQRAGETKFEHARFIYRSGTSSCATFGCPRLITEYPRQASTYRGDPIS